MEAVGAAASILAVAGAGIQISLKLIAFADQVGTAPEKIREVGTDVSVTGGTLQELGELMREETPTKKSALMFKPEQVQNIKIYSGRCDEIFKELKEILGKASQQLRGVYKLTAKGQAAPPKIMLSKLERMKWPFLQPSMESLRSALKDAKGTLTLILQVVHLRHAQTTASLDREEQNDLVRMIVAMSRQQSASTYGARGGVKGLDAGDSEDSESSDPSAIRMKIEAWSVTPNTLSDQASQHFLITPIPISQQQIEKVLKRPQDFREIASVIDSLSFPERDAILGRVLGNSGSHPGDSAIKSISSQSWTGSHDLFGRVTGRKFQLITERRLWKSKYSRTNMRHQSPMFLHRQRHEVHKTHRYHPDSDPPMYDSVSDSDGTHETGAYTHGSSESPPPATRVHERRRPAQAPHLPSFERRRPFSKDDKQRKQQVNEKPHMEQAERARVDKQKLQHRAGGRVFHHPSQPWTEPQPADELSDDELVKRLLAQYTNFERGEPLVQSVATPPPTYDEASAIPKRVPRPY